MLSPADGYEHILEIGIAADALATLEEIFHRDEHGAGVDEHEAVRIALDDDAGHHSPVGMEEAVADGFAEGLVGRGLVDALHIGVQLERMRYGLVHVPVNTVIELEKACIEHGDRCLVSPGNPRSSRATPYTSIRASRTSRWRPP